MKLIKLTVLFSLFIMAISSCERDEWGDFAVEINDVLMSGGQESPANSSSATGNIDATYNKETKILSYNVTWSGLSGNVTGMHIHGATDPGFNAGVLQGFSLGSNNKPSGTYTGSVIVDGQVIREEDLLAGKLYINIHSALYPGGEIRGQLTGWQPADD